MIGGLLIGGRGHVYIHIRRPATQGRQATQLTTQITFVAWLLEVFHKTNHTNPYFDFVPSSLALNSYFNYNKIPRSSG